MVIALFKLMRWPNLLMIAFIQYLIRYSLIIPLNLPHALDDFDFSILVLWSVLQAAGGYIINDIFDQDVDKVNKPTRVFIGGKISESTAWNLYFISVIASIISAYWLSSEIDLSSLWYISPLAALLLYFYASDLQKRPLIGNLTVGILSALPIFLIAIFDLLPITNPENAAQVKQTIEVLTVYSLFAFWTTLIRELIKDAEDKDGDEKAAYKTLAIQLSVKSYKLVISILLLILIAALTLYVGGTWMYDKSSSFYVIIAIILPAVYILLKLWSAHQAKDYHHLSTSMKLLMLLGILSMPFFTLSLIYQWG